MLKGEFILTVYIEYAFIDNFTIDFLLLKTAAKITGSKIKIFRLIFSSTLGTLFALIMPLIKIPLFYSLLIKAAFSFLLVFSSTEFKTKKGFFLFYLSFFLLTFLVGGAVSGVFSLLDIENGKTDVLLFSVIVFAYVFLKFSCYLIKTVVSKKKTCSFLVDCEISVFNKIYKVKGFLDSGNNLKDSFDNSPVIIISKDFTYKFPPEFLFNTNFKYINCITPLKKEKLLVFKADFLKILSGEKEHIYKNVSVGISKNKVLSEDFDVILNNSFMGEGLC